MLSSIKGSSNNPANILKHLGQGRVNKMNYFSTINTEVKSIHTLSTHIMGLTAVFCKPVYCNTVV
jgi:hypothetical protein